MSNFFHAGYLYTAIDNRGEAFRFQCVSVNLTPGNSNPIIAFGFESWQCDDLDLDQFNEDERPNLTAYELMVWFPGYYRLGDWELYKNGTVEPIPGTY